MNDEQRKKLYNRLKYQKTTVLLYSANYHARQRRALLRSLTEEQEEMDVRLEILTLRLNPEARKWSVRHRAKQARGELNAVERAIERTKRS